VINFTTHSFTAKGIRSLSWCGEELVDWVGGARRFSLDGIQERAAIRYAYRFDSAIACPEGRFAVIYEKLGTKGLLLDNGKVVRELNRSFYQAEAYEYPVSFLRGSAGQLLLAHCPNAYCQIDFEDVETGRSLTASNERKPSDFFHSRLAVSPNGKRLLSAGWVWHPWSAVVWFDISRALKDPLHLDRGEPVRSGREEASACWLDDDLLVATGSGDIEDADDEQKAEPVPQLGPLGLAIFDIAQGVCLRAFQLNEPAGTVFAVDRRHILSLYRHPKLIDLETGKIVHAWSDLRSGLQSSSIIWGMKEDAMPPPMTFDPIRKRFAIANGDVVTIIAFLPGDERN
jgi:hypothetical protein